MTAPKWHEATITGFDTETTGTAPHTARIVTSSIVHRIPGQRPKTIDWIIDPGIDIPAEAAAVHGYTRDRILTLVGGEGYALRVSEGRSARMTADGALNEIAAQVATTIHTGTPLVIANAPYDTTLLDAELTRIGIDPISARPTGWAGVVDPMVIEKQLDRWRKQCFVKGPGPDGTDTACDRENRIHVCGGCRGKAGSKSVYDCGGCGITDRTLTSLCLHYGIVLTAAHSASADALAAVRLSVKLAALWPEIGRWLLPTLHRNQADWHREQLRGLRDFFLKVGKTDEAAGMCPEWPVHVTCAPAAETAVAS